MGPQRRCAQPLHTAHLIVTGGTVTGTEPLQVDGDVILRGGTIANRSAGGGLSIGGSIIKQGYGSASLAPTAHDGSFDVKIEQGTLMHLLNGGGTSGVITIAPEFARLVGNNVGISQDVFLNNGRGFGGTGALAASGGPLTVSGTIHLGDSGAVLGLIPGSFSDPSMAISGKIVGGDADFTGRGNFGINSSGHSYTGVTRIGVNGEGTTLSLSNAGELKSTTEIQIGGTMIISNAAQSDADRIGDNIPLALLGRSLSTPYTTGPSQTEKVGPLEVPVGANTVKVQTQSSSLTFGQLNRSGDATINFDLHTIEAFVGKQIMFDQSPALSNGILGGWATTDTDFATFDPIQGILPLGNRVARPSQINAASPQDHVLAFFTIIAPLTADRTVDSLAIEGDGNYIVDLGGHTLAIRSGGFFRGGADSVDGLIQNGRLTAGDSADPATLYIHPQWTFADVRTPGVTISASITDNTSGGAVSLVKSGDVSVTLSAVNSYSGATVVQRGRLYFATQGSLPSNGDLEVDNGGWALLDYESPQATKLNRLKLAHNGWFTSLPTDTPHPENFQIDATQYLLESGRLEVALAGQGTMIKSTDGTANVELDNADFHGPVTVEAGILTAGSVGSGVFTAQHALGTGEVTVMHGATLVHAAIASDRASMRLDADLVLAGGDVGVGTSTVLSQWNFGGPLRVAADSRLLLFNPLSGDGGSAILNFLKPVTLDRGKNLSVLGSGTANLAGGTVVTGEASITAEDGTIGLTNIQPSADAATLHLTGKGNYQFANSIAVDAGKQLTIEIAPGSQARALNPMTVGAGVTLDVNGQLSNAQLFTLNGGTIVGTGTTGDLVNLAGDISPGNSVGVLTVGTYDQRTGGTLSMELLGGPTNAADQLITKTAKLSGLLHVLLVAGSQIAAGQVFDLVVGSQISTDGLTLQTAGFSGRLGVTTLMSGPDAGMQSLQLTIVPEPSSGLLTAIAALLMAARTRKLAASIIRRQD